MTEEDKDAATAYLKLHDDVRLLILNTVLKEINERPYDNFATTLGRFIVERVVEPYAKHNLKQNLRIVFKGDTAPY